MGTFYCQLRYDLTPRTVANFITLADGSKSWLALFPRAPDHISLSTTALSSTASSLASSFKPARPTARARDDPGYAFNNEIAPGLNNDAAGVLAMANAGGTNSNGAQFYITLAPQPSLDGKLHRFPGSVVRGLNVVTNIGNVPTDTSNGPLTPVVISNVTILRIGTAASNFNALAVSPPLPVPQFTASQMLHQGSLLLVWNYAIPSTASATAAGFEDTERLLPQLLRRALHG